MAESDLNKRLRDALFLFDPRRVENAVDPGTPDINYTHGWIESKRLDNWPARPDTVVRVDHYTAGQRGWHVRRCAAGGRVWVALEVGSEFHLLYADMAAMYLGLTWTRADLRKLAAFHSPTWDGRALCRFLLDFHSRTR